MRSFLSASTSHTWIIRLPKASHRPSPLLDRHICTAAPLHYSPYFPLCTRSTLTIESLHQHSMAPKRKKPSAAASVSSSNSTLDDLPGPIPAGNPRRSGRQRHMNEMKAMKSTGASSMSRPKLKADMGLENGYGEDWKIMRSSEAVQKAIKTLSDMEERLQNETKRQRRAIQDSHLNANGSRPDNKPLYPHGLSSPSQNRGNEKSRQGHNEPTLSSPIKAEATHMSDDETNQATERLPEDAEPDGEDTSFERGAARPPPVNSDYLPLPWKGRLGYACLNTYLRNATPPVFSSRTCRIATIQKHELPLMDPSRPEHPKKNPRDKSKPRDIRAGQMYVEEIGLANARDISKMLRWNDRFGIKFMRLSSEMFPFASHPVHGYSLAPFASEVLAEAGQVAAELGHRLTTHPGQFTQLGSPRTEVVRAAIRDLEYHDEMLTLLKLPEQQDRDAIMILHMGGAYGDKPATLDRFRQNYHALSPSLKRRLVLENDDVSWSVHDLLPICEELDIPLVLDFHHHNIVFDPAEVREGTEDVTGLFPRIRATWTRKGITQKMHYSEPCRGAVTPHDRRKHSPRVKTLPPCAPDMDLMIEAKDKEQAVFELMRTFRLPGFEKIADLVPYERVDDERAVGKGGKGKASKTRGSKKVKDEAGHGDEKEEAQQVSTEEFGMGGPLGRVYWPEGMEEWLRPKKKVIKQKEDGNGGMKDDNEDARSQASMDQGM